MASPLRMHDVLGYLDHGSVAGINSLLPMNKLFQITFLLLLAVTTAQATNERIITAVYSHTYNGYQRSKAADGTFPREYYALANGSYLPGVGADASIDKVKFPQIAGLTAQLLAAHNYLLAPDAKQAQLLLVITWGKTIPLNDGVFHDHQEAFGNAMNRVAQAKGAPAGRFNAMTGPASPQSFAENDEAEAALVQLNMANDMRRKANEYNAQLLGYVDEINQREGPARFAGAGTAFDDLNEDIENERYFFVVSAYDFPTAVKTGQRKLLWATRVSVQAQGNKFNETAAYLLAKASKYFGQDSGRLIRQYDPEGKVRLGELQIVGIVPDPRKQEQAPKQN